MSHHTTTDYKFEDSRISNQEAQQQDNESTDNSFLTALRASYPRGSGECVGGDSTNWILDMLRRSLSE